MAATIRGIVLAGGFGTRIRHLLPDVPKPMAPVAGRPFLEWVLMHLSRSAGIDTFLLSTGHLADRIEHHFSAHPLPGLEVQCCPETTPLGTGGGIVHCVHGDTRPPPDFWLVANGDSIVLADLQPLLAAAAAPGHAGALLALRMEDASRFGTVERAPDGTLAGFREKQPGAGLINAGVYLLRHHLIEHFPARRPLSLEHDVFPRLKTDHRIAVVECDAPFIDIGTEASFRHADTFLRENIHRLSPQP
ncbi:MAG: nucleotidyltransferase [Verrucomicrobia bacterium]|nr:MAG: nucleotidyltransferase [Verrucomicrobiota bacterium]